jgi:hypothetical protein
MQHGRSHFQRFPFHPRCSTQHDCDMGTDYTGLIERDLKLGGDIGGALAGSQENILK